MSETELPPLWRALLAEAAAAPDGVLSLKEDPRGEEAVDAAERLTDLGLLRIVTARRYRLSEAGQAALAPAAGKRRSRMATADTGKTDRPSKPAPQGFWRRIFGKKG